MAERMNVSARVAALTAAQARNKAEAERHRKDLQAAQIADEVIGAALDALQEPQRAEALLREIVKERRAEEERVEALKREYEAWRQGQEEQQTAFANKKEQLKKADEARLRTLNAYEAERAELQAMLDTLKTELSAGREESKQLVLGIAELTAQRDALRAEVAELENEAGAKRGGLLASVSASTPGEEG